ncbi:MAG: transposase [Verrucomicrobiota bacterium]
MKVGRDAPPYLFVDMAFVNPETVFMSEDDSFLPVRKVLPHGVPMWVREGSVWFITICTAERGTAVLTESDVAERLLNAASFYHDRKRWYVHLFLIMPDHIHALITFGYEEKMSKLVAQWKSYTAKEAGIRWQQDFFDHRLRSNESMSEKARYVRENPVRAGLVERGEDWPWQWEPPENEKMPPRIG